MLEPVFRIATLSLLSKFSIIFPHLNVLLEHQIVLCALKSPVKMKGLGSCCIKLSSSISVRLCLGEIYMLHIVILLGHINCCGFNICV